MHNIIRMLDGDVLHFPKPPRSVSGAVVQQRAAYIPVGAGHREIGSNNLPISRDDPVQHSGSALHPDTLYGLEPPLHLCNGLWPVGGGRATVEMRHTPFNAIPQP